MHGAITTGIGMRMDQRLLYVHKRIDTHFENKFLIVLRNVIYFSVI